MRPIQKKNNQTFVLPYSTQSLIIKSLSSPDKIRTSDFPEYIQDWQSLLDLTRIHGLLPLFWNALKDYADELPVEITSAFRQEFIKQIAAYEMKKKLFLPILEILSENLQHLIILKGLYLSENFYQEAALRSFGDRDILIDISERKKAKEILVKSGFLYFEQWDRFFWEKPQEIWNFKTIKEPYIMIELHSHFLSKPRYRRALNLDMDKVWPSLSKTKIGDITIDQLSLPYLLIYLAFHLTITHRFDRLVWIYDIHRVIITKDKEIDWSELAEICRQARAQTFLYLALDLSRQLFATPVPDSFLAELKPSYFSLALFQKLFKKKNLLDLPKYSFSDLLFFTLRDDFRYRLTAWLCLPYRVARLYLKGNAW